MGKSFTNYNNIQIGTGSNAGVVYSYGIDRNARNDGREELTAGEL